MSRAQGSYSLRPDFVLLGGSLDGLGIPLLATDVGDVSRGGQFLLRKSASSGLGVSEGRSFPSPNEHTAASVDKIIAWA